MLRKGAALVTAQETGCVCVSVCVYVCVHMRGGVGGRREREGDGMITFLENVKNIFIFT